MRAPFAIPLALALAVASALPGRAGATMYKCAGDNKQPVYQDSPCPPGRELRNFDANPVEITVLPAPNLPATPPGAPAARGAKTAPPAEQSLPPAKARDPADRRLIHSGMTEAEVTAKIGPPDMTSTAKGRKSARWSYLPAPGDPHTITTIRFDDGKVVEVERKVSQ
jgi:hypothetical protein